MYWLGTGPVMDQAQATIMKFMAISFYQNPHESLFQGEGNLALYNNLFVNEYGDAIRIQPHNDIPKNIDIFFNTVLARDKGIVIQTATGTMSFRQTVGGNAVFAEVPLTGGKSSVQYRGTVE